MQTSHTPGPWFHDGGPWIYGPHHPQSKHGNKRICIGEVCSAHADKLDDEAKANAHLIATAPEMLAMLEMARTWIDRAEQHLINHVEGGKAIQADHGAGTLAEIDAALEAVIAKARGERR